MKVKEWELLNNRCVDDVQHVTYHSLSCAQPSWGRGARALGCGTSTPLQSCGRGTTNGTRTCPAGWRRPSSTTTKRKGTIRPFISHPPIPSPSCPSPLLIFYQPLFLLLLMFCSFHYKPTPHPLIFPSNSLSSSFFSSFFFYYKPTPHPFIFLPILYPFHSFSLPLFFPMGPLTDFPAIVLVLVIRQYYGDSF